MFFHTPPLIIILILAVFWYYHSKASFIEIGLSLFSLYGSSRWMQRIEIINLNTST